MSIYRHTGLESLDARALARRRLLLGALIVLAAVLGAALAILNSQGA